MINLIIVLLIVGMAILLKEHIPVPAMIGLLAFVGTFPFVAPTLMSFWLLAGAGLCFSYARLGVSYRVGYVVREANYGRA